MKNEKILFICFVICFSFSSCASTRNTNDIADIIARNSQSTGRLEATVKELDRTIIDSRKRIENIVNSSRGITNGIERVEYLFSEYEQETNRLLNQIDTIRNNAKTERENN